MGWPYRSARPSQQPVRYREAATHSATRGHRVGSKNPLAVLGDGPSGPHLGQHPAGQLQPLLRGKLLGCEAARGGDQCVEVDDRGARALHRAQRLPCDPRIGVGIDAGGGQALGETGIRAQRAYGRMRAAAE